VGKRNSVAWITSLAVSSFLNMNEAARI